MAEAYIRLNNVSKTYRSPDHGRIQILQQLDFEIHEKQTLSIVGASGSGKSTLLNVMAGLDQIDSGNIYVDGKDIWKLSDELISRVRNQEFGFVFQSHFLLPEFTALENVLIPTWIRKSKNMDNKARQLLEAVGLSGRLNHKPSQLSGGESQRVAIARSLINSPKIIFADEPTGNLDFQNAQKVMEILLSLVKDFHTALVLVTHDQKMAAMMGSGFVLKNGQLYSMSE